jgi:hypothetical protein
MTNGSSVAVSALLGLMATSAAQADLTTIDADAYAPGTDVSNVFDGVTLTHLTFAAGTSQSSAAYAAGCTGQPVCSALGAASIPPTSDPWSDVVNLRPWLRRCGRVRSSDGHAIASGGLMNRTRKLFWAAACSVALAGTAFAHHGWTGYSEEIQKLSGVIGQASYSNPHGSIQLKTADKTWEVVLAPPSRMTTRGLTEDMLKVGTTATVEGYQSKTDEKELRAERITIAGKTVELR